MADNKPSTLTTKQKVLGAITVIIFGFVIYEVMGLFSSNNAAESTITPIQSNKVVAQTKPNTTTTRTTTNVTTPPSANASSQQSTLLTTVTPLVPPSKPDVAVLKEQEEQQQTYLDSINQLQLLKVKRDIAETNQAIATARLATETANKSMSDLLTQPSFPQAPGGGFGPKNSGETSPLSETNVQVVAPVVETPFVVISVAMKFHRWNAVLGYGGKLYSVSVGDTLFDGSVIAAINSRGVVLVKDGKRRSIGILATI